MHIMLFIIYYILNFIKFQILNKKKIKNFSINYHKNLLL